MSVTMDILFTCVFLKYLKLQYQAPLYSVEDILSFPVICHVLALHAGNFGLFLCQEVYQRNNHILWKEERQVKYIFIMRNNVHLMKVNCSGLQDYFSVFNDCDG